MPRCYKDLRTLAKSRMKSEKARACLGTWVLVASMGLVGGLARQPLFTLLGAAIALEAARKWEWWRSHMTQASRVGLDSIACALPAAIALASGRGAQAVEHILPCVAAFSAIQLRCSRAGAFLVLASSFWLVPSVLI